MSIARDGAPAANRLNVRGALVGPVPTAGARDTDELDVQDG